MLPATHYPHRSSSNEICKVSYTRPEHPLVSRNGLTKMVGSSNKIWCQNGGQNISITRSDLISSVTPHLSWLTVNVYRLGKKRSKQSHGLSKASIKPPKRLDVNCLQTSSIMSFNRQFVITLLYKPHPQPQTQIIAPQLSHPMALQKIRFMADRPRHKLVLTKS